MFISGRRFLGIEASIEVFSHWSPPRISFTENKRDFTFDIGPTRVYLSRAGNPRRYGRSDDATEYRHTEDELGRPSGLGD